MAVKPSAPLHEYRRKRQFPGTPEPEAPPRLAVVLKPGHAGHSFCVQEHHASRLHYDFRLEIEGVLKSWALPKGPSLDPEVKRLAMATEDHPLDYLTFEGRIPEGNYGAGEVIVWDVGEYESVGDTPPLRQWEQGHLKFRLHGKKLNGEFVLAHMPAHPGKNGGQNGGQDNAWLLIKKRDQAERFGDTAAFHPGSVLKTPTGPRLVAPPAAAALRPMLASLGDRPFRDPAWLFEVKWDGIRALAHCRQGSVKLISRTTRDLTAQYPELAQFGASFDAVLDGEIVVVDAGGKSSFPRLQQRMNLVGADGIARAAAEIPACFYAFDLLSLQGRDLTQQPLIERKRQLAALPWRAPWRYSDHVVGDGVGLFEAARSRGLEGIVAKRADSHYEAGRSRQWLKFKLQQRQEAVIVGYTDPQGSRTAFGALLLAVWDPHARKFVSVGRVGTGFDTATRRDILDRLHPQAKPVVAAAASGAVHWVKPEWVVEVKFAQWTPAGLMRAPVFFGLRADKTPRECVRETSHA